MSNYVQLILLCSSESPENKNCVLGSLLVFAGKFISDLVIVNNFREGSSEIRDKYVQEVIWSSVIDINGVSSLDGIELCVVSFNKEDRGLWFVNKAESIKQVSKLVDIKEIFGSFLQPKCSYSGIGFSRYLVSSNDQGSCGEF